MRQPPRERTPRSVCADLRLHADVHYEGMNRRMDQWVTLDRFDLGSVTEAAGKLTRTSKRKHEHEERAPPFEPGTCPPACLRACLLACLPLLTIRPRVRLVLCQEHEEEGELDLATLKEHEEATKVKNVTRIQFGEWQMETWYFSPFPKEFAHVHMLYFCEFDLSFFARKEQLERYLKVQ